MSNNIPAFRVTLAGADISDKLRPRLISLRVSEKRGDEADQLDITLDDADGKLAIPKAGVELQVSLGWSAGSNVVIGMVDKGRFIVDEVEHRGPPDQITIRARSADFTSQLTSRGDKSWHNTTLGAIIQDIAGRNGLAARCAPALAGKSIKAMSQTRESDIAFLRRLGRQFDAVATIKSKSLIFAPIGAGITASGKPLPAITIKRGDGDSHTYRIEKREAAGTVSAQWRDRKGAKNKKVTVGSGEGTERTLSRVYPTEAAARDAATAESKRATRAPKKLSLNLALGRLDLAPEQKVTTSGFKTEIDETAWLIAEVTHDLNGNSGFRSNVQLELAS